LWLCRAQDTILRRTIVYLIKIFDILHHTSDQNIIESNISIDFLQKHVLFCKMYILFTTYLNITLFCSVIVSRNGSCSHTFLRGFTGFDTCLMAEIVHNLLKFKVLFYCIMIARKKISWYVIQDFI